MAEQNPNARPDEQTPEQDALEKSLEELSLDERLRPTRRTPPKKRLSPACSRSLSRRSRRNTRI